MKTSIKYLNYIQKKIDYSKVLWSNLVLRLWLKGKVLLFENYCCHSMFQCWIKYY